MNIILLGHLEIEQLYYDPQDNKIVCISSGGPAERILWKKNNQELFIVDQSYKFSQTIDTNGRYKNTLKFIYKGEDDSGNYTCEVRNKLDQTSSVINITGEHPLFFYAGSTS